MNETTFVKLLTELTKKTAQGQLTWSRKDVPRHYTTGTDHVYPDYYETSYKGQSMGAGIMRYREYDGERDSFYWTSTYFFILLNEYNEVIWNEESRNSALINLFEIVRDKTANVEVLIKNLLDSDDS